MYISVLYYLVYAYWLRCIVLKVSHLRPPPPPTTTTNFKIVPGPMLTSLYKNEILNRYPSATEH